MKQPPLAAAADAAASLTPTALSAGLTLSTFATSGPTFGCPGPMGIVGTTGFATRRRTA